VPGNRALLGVGLDGDHAQAASQKLSRHLARSGGKVEHPPFIPREQPGEDLVGRQETQPVVVVRTRPERERTVRALGGAVWHRTGARPLRLLVVIPLLRPPPAHLRRSSMPGLLVIALRLAAASPDCDGRTDPDSSPASDVITSL
jgi:hypothetical protein